jgi:hypothetical protein
MAALNDIRILLDFDQIVKVTCANVGLDSICSTVMTIVTSQHFVV